MPALNEARTISSVVAELRALQHDEQPLLDQIIVCDNGSRDDTAARAQAAGAVVVSEPQRGYGAACQRAAAALAPCSAVLYVDADGSVDVQDIPPLLSRWQDGADLVIGSRRLGTVLPGGMSVPQRLGNRLACALMSLVWRQPVTDLGPLRLIDRRALTDLHMCDRGYGWTAEMQCKALNAGLRIDEVPVTVAPRIGRSRISGNLRGIAAAGYGILGMVLRQAAIRYRRVLDPTVSIDTRTGEP
ncbi:MAG: glycosyltransferase family 2 protein [Pseudomonadota bacterium]